MDLEILLGLPVLLPMVVVVDLAEVMALAMPELEDLVAIANFSQEMDQETKVVTTATLATSIQRSTR